MATPKQSGTPCGRAGGRVCFFPPHPSIWVPSRLSVSFRAAHEVPAPTQQQGWHRKKELCPDAGILRSCVVSTQFYFCPVLFSARCAGDTHSTKCTGAKSLPGVKGPDQGRVYQKAKGPLAGKTREEAAFLILHHIVKFQPLNEGWRSMLQVRMERTFSSSKSCWNSQFHSL